MRDRIKLWAAMNLCLHRFILEGITGGGSASSDSGSKAVPKYQLGSTYQNHEPVPVPSLVMTLQSWWGPWSLSYNFHQSHLLWFSYTHISSENIRLCVPIMFHLTILSLCVSVSLSRSLVLFHGGQESTSATSNRGYGCITSVQAYPSMVAHTFDPSRPEAEAGGCLWIWGHPGLQNKLRGS